MVEERREGKEREGIDDCSCQEIYGSIYTEMDLSCAFARRAPLCADPVPRVHACVPCTHLRLMYTLVSTASE